MSSPVTRHFDSIAQEYDYWKKKNWYYHGNLKRLLRSKIPAHARIVEIGCGTGDLLASLKPSEGLGIDISPEMISVARTKHADKTKLRFLATDIADIPPPLDYEVVFMADVLEHIEDTEGFFGHLERLMEPGAMLVITIANPFWEPLLMLAEKLRFKMPEGPHERLPLADTELAFQRHGFSIKEKGSDLLCPIPLPFADQINKTLGKLPLIRRLQFVRFWVLEKK
jgi:2-polyprenyl-3-methyl-5-hydroxy-6-metoxy-1,4-benzoquinol methylase